MNLIQSIKDEFNMNHCTQLIAFVSGQIVNYIRNDKLNEPLWLEFTILIFYCLRKEND